jgi:hypothetical protein
MKCKGCGGTKIRRSHRAHPLEKALGLLGYYPYRCDGCDARFFKHIKRISDQATSDTVAVKQTREKRWERQQLEMRRKNRLMLLYVAGMMVFALVAFLFILRPPSSWHIDPR